VTVYKLKNVLNSNPAIGKMAAYRDVLDRIVDIGTVIVEIIGRY